MYSKRPGTRKILAYYKAPFFERHPVCWWLYVGVLWLAAAVWRLIMFRTTFIAITGSVGKTTAKECLATILSEHAPTAKSKGTANWIAGVPLAILGVRPWHRYAVIEVGAARRGAMRYLGRLVRPHLALILAVRREHTAEFPTLEEMAAEKALLAKCVPARGRLVLNADDPLVREMGRYSRAVTFTFGKSPENFLRYRVRPSPWPSRLTLELECDGRSEILHTQLVGQHWAPSVAGAVTVARLLGFDFPTIARGAHRIEPVPGRMCPCSLPGNIIILREEYGSAPDSFEASVAVLRQASAPRRIAVFGEISETGLDRAAAFRFVGRSVAGAADILIFVGAGEASLAAGAAQQAGMPRSSVYSFRSVRDATNFLRELLRPGDLVLLKGRLTNHLSRVYFGLFGSLSCWKESCERRYLCDECPDLGFKPDPRTLNQPVMSATREVPPAQAPSPSEATEPSLSRHPNDL